MAKPLGGAALVAALHRKFEPKVKGGSRIRGALATRIGYSAIQIWSWQKRNAPVTGAQIANIVSKAANQAQRETIKPIVEFYDFVPTNEREIKRTKKIKTLKSYKLFDDRNLYERGVKEELAAKHGVYIFYDSRGRALYVGKATDQTLLKEMTNVLNRPRAVQNIKKVRHPHREIKFKTSNEKRRQIVSVNIKLHDVAYFVSAYEVPTHIIDVFEAVLVRSFANDLLNVRIEQFSSRRRKKSSKKKKRRQ